MAGECPTPTKTGLFQRLIRKDFPDSVKAWGSVTAISILASVALGIGGCIAYRVAVAGDVGSGAVGAFLAVTGPLSILAGANYRKPEEIGNTSSTTTTTTETSAAVPK